MSGIAFFDLDLTILSCNSATLWIKRELKLGFLSRTYYAKAAWWVALYQLGFANLERVIEEAIASLEGQSEAEIHQRTLDFWAEIEPQIRPGARAAVERHRAAGDHLALLTSSSNYLSQPVVDLLGLHETLCNRFEVVDGVFTGKSTGPLCFGPGKIHHAEALSTRLGIPLSECTFYTDSYSDLPVLERVGQPVAVHPDPRLNREAKRRGWRIERWDEAG